MPEPAALVRWVEDRAALDVSTLALCRWDLDALGMAPTVLTEVTIAPGR